MSKPLPANIDKLSACIECDLLLEAVSVPNGYQAHCPRCGHLLYHPVQDSVDKIQALSWAGLFLSFPAYTLPVLKLGLVGDEQAVSLLSGVGSLFGAGYWLVALAVLLTCIVLPLLKKMLLLHIAWHLRLHRAARFLPLATAFRFYHHVAEWGMLEVLVLGIAVAAIKLRDMGELHPGLGLYCFVAVLATATLQTLNLDGHWFWANIERLENATDG